MTASVGALVGLTYDSPRGVCEADVIRTGTSRCYRVQKVRRQERGKHAGRWHIVALVIDPDTVTDTDTVLPLHWYRR